MRMPELQPSHITTPQPETKRGGVTFNEFLSELEQLKDEIADYERKKKDPALSGKERAGFHAKWLMAKIKLVEAEMARDFLEPSREQEKKSEKDIDLDFTQRPAIEGMEVKEEDFDEKVAELKRQIAAAERGIKLAENLGDSERADTMKRKKEEFEQSLSMLTQEERPVKIEHPVKAVNDSDFNFMGGTEDELSARRFDAQESKRKAA